MAATTTKLGLTKPAADEAVDVSVLNGNFDLIDAAFAALSGVASNGGNIPSGADLNDFNTMGIYQTTSNSIASSLTNCPSTVSFMMIVGRRGSYALQLLITNRNIFIRAKSSSGWAGWYKIEGTAVT